MGVNDVEESTNRHLEASELAVLDENMLFDELILQFLLSKLTEEDKAVLRDIADKSDDPYGYLKTQVPDYNKKRRKYEITWGKLEAQGLMKVEVFGHMRLCRLTIRGNQAVNYLNEHSKG